MTCLGRLELTNQPEKVFYKDEGGHKHYFLFVFFILQGERTAELRKALDGVADGRGKVPISCEVLHGTTMKPVEAQDMLKLYGNCCDSSIPDHIVDVVPEFDVQTYQGSVRYRMNKVSMRQDNQSYRIKVALKGLETEIQSAVSEPTMVLSKRRNIRKAHRLPEMSIRQEIENQAQRRNAEAEARFGRMAPTTTPVILMMAKETGFTALTPYPTLKHTPDEEPPSAGDKHPPAKRTKKQKESSEEEKPIPPTTFPLTNGMSGISLFQTLDLSSKLKSQTPLVRQNGSEQSPQSGRPTVSHDPEAMYKLIQNLQQRVEELEKKQQGFERALMDSNMSYAPQQNSENPLLKASTQSSSTQQPESNSHELSTFPANLSQLSFFRGLTQFPNETTSTSLV